MPSCLAHAALSDSELDHVMVLAESRSDGRVTSFGMEKNPDLEILNPRLVYLVDMLPATTGYLLTIGDWAMDSGDIVADQDSCALYTIQR